MMTLKFCKLFLICLDSAAELEWENNENSELLAPMQEEEEETEGGDKPVSNHNTNLDRLAPLSSLSEFRLDELDA